MEKINVLCATDNNYVPYCGIMLTSLFENNKDLYVDVYILTDFIDQKNTTLLKSFEEEYTCCMHILNVNSESNRFKDFPIRQGDHISIATYYRILAPLFLPTDIDKILYLDCDIIINSSLWPLYEEDVNDYAVGCVWDECLSYKSFYQRLSYPEYKKYFNAGVLLMNLQYWRDHSVMQRSLKCIASIPDKLLLYDQDTLNVVLQDEKKILSPTYNFQTGYLFCCAVFEPDFLKQIMQHISNPTIIHYTGPFKPWDWKPRHPYTKYFLYYKSLSKWKDLRISKPSLPIMFRYYLCEFIWRVGIKPRPKTYII